MSFAYDLGKRVNDHKQTTSMEERGKVETIADGDAANPLSVIVRPYNANGDPASGVIRVAMQGGKCALGDEIVYTRPIDGSGRAVYSHHGPNTDPLAGIAVNPNIPAPTIDSTTTAFNVAANAPYVDVTFVQANPRYGITSYLVRYATAEDAALGLWQIAGPVAQTNSPDGKQTYRINNLLASRLYLIGVAALAPLYRSEYTNPSSEITTATDTVGPPQPSAPSAYQDVDSREIRVSVSPYNVAVPDLAYMEFEITINRPGLASFVRRFTTGRDVSGSFTLPFWPTSGATGTVRVRGVDTGGLPGNWSPTPNPTITFDNTAPTAATATGEELPEGLIRFRAVIPNPPPDLRKIDYRVTIGSSQAEYNDRGLEFTAIPFTSPYGITPYTVELRLTDFGGNSNGWGSATNITRDTSKPATPNPNAFDESGGIITGGVTPQGGNTRGYIYKIWRQLGAGTFTVFRTLPEQANSTFSYVLTKTEKTVLANYKMSATAVSRNNVPSDESTPLYPTSNPPVGDYGGELVSTINNAIKNMADVSTNARTLTASSSVVFNVASASGGFVGAAFNGTDSYIGTSAFTPPSGSQTFEALVEVDSAGGGYIGEFSDSSPAGGSASERGLRVRRADGYAIGRVDSPEIGGSSDLRGGALRHIVLRAVASGALELYVDGSLVSSNASWSMYNGYGSPRLNIGNGNGGGDSWFSGRVFHYAVYDAALSAVRIAAHNTAKSSASGYFAAVDADSNRLFDLRFGVGAKIAGNVVDVTTLPKVPSAGVADNSHGIDDGIVTAAKHADGGIRGKLQSETLANKPTASELALPGSIDSIIPNADMEVFDGQLPRFWSLAVTAGSATWGAVTGGYALSGSKSLGVTSTAGGTNIIIKSDLVPVTQFERYAFRTLVGLGLGTGTFALKVRWVDGSGADIGTSTVATISGGGTLKGTWVAPVLSVFAEVQLVATSLSSGATPVFDLVRMRPIIRGDMIEPSPTIIGTLTADGLAAGTTGVASNGPISAPSGAFSGGLSVSGDLGVTGAQTNSGKIFANGGIAVASGQPAAFPTGTTVNNLAIHAAPYTASELQPTWAAATLSVGPSCKSTTISDATGLSFTVAQVSGIAQKAFVVWQFELDLVSNGDGEIIITDGSNTQYGATCVIRQPNAGKYPITMGALVDIPAGSGSTTIKLRWLLLTAGKTMTITNYDPGSSRPVMRPAYTCVIMRA